MSRQNQVAREISYAYSASTKSGRALIRVMENATGRIGLIKRAQGYEDEVAAGRDFWAVMKERYGLTLEVVGGSLSNIPQTGPLIAIANHPYGILDGLMLGHILSETRGDFRILANQVFSKAEDLDRIVLPVSFDETKDALKLNLQTRKVALDYLKEGGAIGIFPGGTVSTAVRPFGHPLDPGWRGFTARMVAKSEASVVPIFFDGTTSRLFQIASHVHVTLRMGFLIREFKKRVDRPVQIAVGKPIDADILREKSRDTKALMDFLRQQTYALSPKPIPANGYGFEFDGKYRAQ
ncbi:lysophospholipid acyltransferase family protein [Shimia thalassica]|uniref:lysophospholipid acyltransferase family protein n=1 Tax=Shimia thalassica TaxID=1715693 RepID=UPI000C069CAA|nr:lysophospholipid acyltransferase family protein [Shimia thalassica]PHO03818.1 acyltransferase [Rhodobacteraceae bacterium 4F10]MBU2941715.1 lysophospholipid acyltransferase family protein [Shimia thalassica]MDO6480613.1 lysophospholipid acyltransferase family protein [Shimia thalassica]MDO6483709.1 lysophospholipid acyltransferase family protein [Shimia thalassica]MDO6503904.1 lysophospholipid acyltransferase family protein [Shimia thalassica]